MIKYVIGDATNPIGFGKKYIIHVCNDCVPGRWGSGFVIAISNRWKKPEQEYRKWSLQKNFKLGGVQFVPVTEDITVVNMIGQHGIKQLGEIVPVRYEAIRECLQKIAKQAKQENATIHGPMFGSNRSGGKWEIIEQIINEELVMNDIDVTIYDLK